MIRDMLKKFASCLCSGSDVEAGAETEQIPLTWKERRGSISANSKRVAELARGAADYLSNLQLRRLATGTSKTDDFWNNVESLSAVRSNDILLTTALPGCRIFVVRESHEPGSVAFEPLWSETASTDTIAV